MKAASARALGLAVLASGCVAQAAPTEWSVTRLSQEVCGEDDWSGFNRPMFWIEDAVVDYIGCPLSWVYCSIVPKPLVKGVDNAVSNIEYPIRLFSSLFRAEWGGAWDETCRFCVNTTVGLGGLFDPAKDWFRLYSTDSSMSGTLAAWGIPRGESLILPFVPRGNIRDDFGYGLDKCLDPKTYFDIFFPTGVGIGWSASFWPNYAAVWIDPWEDDVDAFVDRYAAYRQLVSAKSLLNEDLATYRYATELAAGRAETRRPPVRPPLEKPAGLRGRWCDLVGFEPRTPALDTLRTHLFRPVRDDDFWWERHSLWNGDFARDVEERSVMVATNFPAVRYGYVPAPSAEALNLAERLVFVIPGIDGTHRGRSTLAMAELVHNMGVPVVVCDDPFHWEYMMSANEGRLPGYLPDDAKRYAAFIRAALADLKADGLADDPEVSIVGWSMGGLVTCHLAALEEREGLGFRTGRLLAINPPVAFGSIETAIDGFLAPSRAWDAAAAKTNFVEITSRLAVWSRAGAPETPDISEEDAGYTVAIALGATLPGLVACATKTNADVSVHDYFCRYVHGQHPEKDIATLAREAGLLALVEELRANRHLRMIHTRDDFLLSDADRDYLDATLDERITWFSAGAHCGMFHTLEFQNEVLTRLNLIDAPGE